MERYVILHDLSRTGLGDPFGLGLRDSSETPLRGVAAPEPQVDSAQLSRHEHAAMVRDPEVTALTPVMPTKLIQPVPANGAYDDQPTSWGIRAVRADESPATGSGVVVAVLDTGIDADHAAFADVEIVQRDFTGTADGDNNGHGTHCAGTIVGQDIEGTRIGIARGVSKVLAGKVLGDAGGGDSNMIFQGIQWAVENGANVISMSLGFDFPGFVDARVAAGWPADLAASFALEAYRGNLRLFDALMAFIRAREAFGSGALVVAAAGNESKRDIHPEYEIGASLPAAADGVISVGAVGPGEPATVPSFSNAFPVVAAPGVAIESAAPGGGTAVMSGTSMACPHVAGIAALWCETARDSFAVAPPTMVAAKIRATARADVFAENVDRADRGAGLVTAPVAAAGG